MPNGPTRIYVFRPPPDGPNGQWAKLKLILGVIIGLYLLSLALSGPGSLLRTLQIYLVFIPVILLSLTVHEFAHAVMADFLGDPTPRRMGRLSLNPLRHLDLFGTIMLFFTHFGWARPVQVNPENFRVPQRAMLSVALAGPLSNIALAALGAGMLKLSTMILAENVVPPMLMQIALLFCASLILINLSLATFNLLPFPPLDGSRVVAYFMPPRYRLQYRSFEEMGPLLLLILFALGAIGVLLSPLITNGIYLLFDLFQIDQAFLQIFRYL